MSMEQEEPKVTYDDLNRIDTRIRSIDKKIRLLVRMLVDKKIIGPELAKSFEETEVTDIKKILEWYENR